MKKTIKLLCILTALILCCGLLPAHAAEAPVSITSIKTAGFTVENFSADNTYYLSYPEDFDGIQFTEIKTNIDATVSISVERYCDCDYRKTYTVKQELYLGYGRARVTVTVTSKADSKNTKSYLFALTDPKQDTYRYRYFNGTVPVYTTTSAKDSNLIANFRGTTFSSMPLCIATKGAWTQIVIPSSSTQHHGKIGWIKTEDLVEEYAQTPMPYTYKDEIAALKKAHPNWTFEYRYMGTPFATYVNTVAGQTISNTTKGETTGKKYIEYYMNPENFLNEQNVFMFLDLTRYNSRDYTQKGISGVWIDKSGAVCTKDQALDYISSAGNSLRMNTYFITSRGAIESAYGTSKLAKGSYGIDKNKPENQTKLFYNFYGIGAYDHDPANGGLYAEKRDWDTPYRSIVEGANWINDQYVQRGQSTAYFFRFYPYNRNHIYMSDLSAPKTESGLLYKAYKAAGKLDSNLHFIIPVYDMPYPDVDEKAWYYEDVYRATEYKLFEGMEDGSFRPEQELTRAQLVTVLYRISGAKVTGVNLNQFTDVTAKDWHYRYVYWAYTNNIVKGVSSTSFAPDRAITRQELCTMLARFATTQKIKLPVGKLTFTDRADIAKWAADGVAACVGAGLVNGMPNGTFAPNDSATRAQGAKILSLFYESYLQK